MERKSNNNLMKSFKLTILGFTLVELLAVIVILSIILVIVVPKVMTIIEDAKIGTLESTAKMIASSAEKKKIENNIMNKELELTCENVVKVNDVDYEKCSIEFEGNVAKVTIIGSGKFEGLYVCKGTKTTSKVVNESCTLVPFEIDLTGGKDEYEYALKYEAGSEVILEQPVRGGYRFNGWKVTGSNSSISGNKLIMGIDSTKVIAQWEPIYATEMISDLLVNENTLKNGLKQINTTYISENNEEIIIDTGIRYVGNDTDVKNKVYYNCDEIDSNNINYGDDNYDYANACEIWRIIGVFDVDSGSGLVEKRLKIVNTASTFKASWDSSYGSDEIENSINYGGGINQWGESTYEDGSYYEGADIMRLLNGYYIGKGTSCKYCNNIGQVECSNICDTSDNTMKSQYMKPLTNIAKNMISNAIWYTNALHWETGVKPTAQTAYLQERGILEKYNGKTECGTYNEGYCSDKVIRKEKWTGQVGLIYYSDSLYGEGWINNDVADWLITPASYHGTARLIIATSTVILASNVRIVWPTVYLNKNVIIASGDGDTEPYRLIIE